MPLRWKEAPNRGPGFLTATFAEDATPEDVLRGIIPHLDNAYRATGFPASRGCDRCNRALTGLVFIVGALREWEKKNPPPESVVKPLALSARKQKLQRGKVA
jgi:hypothetical protein